VLATSLVIGEIGVRNQVRYKIQQPPWSSTLLDVLAQRSSHKTTGVVLVNGSDPTVFVHRFGYVKQETTFFESLTIRETLQFTADLQMHHNKPNDKVEKVSKLLEEMDLNKCSNTRIANVSGGEKKRVSLAMELVKEPVIFFCE
jgi:ABC-type multidrug transport system ATPase subunit